MKLTLTTWRGPSVFTATLLLLCTGARLPTVAIAQGSNAVETDVFPHSLHDVTLMMPDGSTQTIGLRGPAAMAVYLRAPRRATRRTTTGTAGRKSPPC